MYAVLLLTIWFPLPPLRTKEFSTLEDISAVMSRKIVESLFDNLTYLQDFDEAKIYYNNGQQSHGECLTQDHRLHANKERCHVPQASPTGYRLS